MYTRCPHCDSQQAVTTQQLRKKRGMLNCIQCGERFDALAALTEQLNDAAASHSNQSQLWASKPETAESGWLWGMGSALLLMGLMAQVAYFDGEKLLRQPVLYQAFSNVCHRLGCQVPVFSNPDDWVLSHSDLETHLDQRYLLTAALTNQADQAQTFPMLKLIFKDFKGQMLAERVFEPQQYTDENLLAANGTALVRLPIILPGHAIGGYSLNLL
jgi:predicted Zn finger-like uncharacterized protein